tara:strand:+ start:410 stop:1423 length:1014 start_codon:yes stop_codon:yes gene_type:complete
MKKLLVIVVLSLLGFNISSFGKNKQPTAGPNCHIIHSAKSINSGTSYKKISSKLLKSASVPDAVIFNNKKLIYYVNGDFDNHSIYVAEITDDLKTTKAIGPIKLNGEINKNAVDPDLIITEDGKIRLFYYVGLFTKPVTEKKPNKFYSAISEDGINFKIEGVVVELDNATDPTVVKLPNGDYLLAIAQGEIQNIEIYKSSDGKKFNRISSIKGGIPELSVTEDGRPEILFQDAKGILKMTSNDGGKKWKKTKSNVLKGNSKGSASPSVLRINEKERIIFYFKIKKGCSTPPTAYLENKNALGSKEMGDPPLGDGVKPKDLKEMGDPPLGHGVKPKKK